MNSAEEAPWPLVSIVIPAHNAAAFLAEALQSVLDQRYPALQVIVVDDGSTDGTADIAAAFSLPMEIVRCPVAGGVASARNAGLGVVRGDYIAFLDADDVWLPGKLHAQVSYLHSHPEVPIVFGRFLRWEPNALGQFDPPPQDALGHPHAAGRLAAPSGCIFPDMLMDSVVHIITAMVRRSALDAIGRFDETLPTGEDYDFWLRASQIMRIDQLDQVLACYRIHTKSLTHTMRPENGEYAVLQRFLHQQGKIGFDGRGQTEAALQLRLAGICFGHAYMHFWGEGGSATQARRAFAQYLTHQPMEPKVWVYWCISAIKAWWTRT